MNPQDQYLDLELRIDRARSIARALWEFYEAPNEELTLKALAALMRLLEEKP